ncbi:hypothetical protein HDU83_009571 [Entophlyctis luteolus]|nr:hypothetical protein HDU83_009571 [Entophlyctis luteolus]
MFSWTPARARGNAAADHRREATDAFLTQVAADEEIVELEPGARSPVFTTAFKAAFVERLATAVAAIKKESTAGPADAVDATLARVVGAPFTVLVAGGAGLGKSSLINAVFGVDIARAGAGVAITLEATSFLDPSGWARIIDSAGFSRGPVSLSDNLSFRGDDLLAFIELTTSPAGATQFSHVDMIWYFVDRIHSEDVSVLKKLVEKQIPFLIMIAKCDSKSEEEVLSIRTQIHDLLSPQPADEDSTAAAIDTIIHNLDLDAPVRGWDIVELRNPPKKNGPKCQECGTPSSVLKPIVQLQRNAWFCSKPECLFSTEFYLAVEDTRSLRDSLALLSGAINSLLENIPTRRLQMVQLLDITPKKKASISIVTTATIAAAGIGAAPIPIADTPLLLATQYTMILAICRVFGVQALGLNDSRFYVSILAASPFPFLGILAAGAAKAIPGVGSVGAAVVEAPIAAGLTMAMGIAVIRTCAELHRARVRSGGAGGAPLEFRFDKDVQRAVHTIFTDTAAWIRKAVKAGGFNATAVGDRITGFVDGGAGDGGSPSTEVPMLAFDSQTELADDAAEVAVDVEQIQEKLAERTPSAVAAQGARATIRAREKAISKAITIAEISKRALDGAAGAAGKVVQETSIFYASADTEEAS